MQFIKVVNSQEFQTSEPILWVKLKKGQKAGLECVCVNFSPELFRYGMALKSNGGFVKACIQELNIDLWNMRFQ